MNIWQETIRTSPRVLIFVFKESLTPVQLIAFALIMSPRWLNEDGNHYCLYIKWRRRCRVFDRDDTLYSLLYCVAEGVKRLLHAAKLAFLYSIPSWQSSLVPWRMLGSLCAKFALLQLYGTVFSAFRFCANIYRISRFLWRPIVDSSLSLSQWKRAPPYGKNVPYLYFSLFPNPSAPSLVYAPGHS